MMRILVMLTMLVALVGCDDAPLGQEGASCLEDSDCADELTCEFGACRDDCTFDNECGADGACVALSGDPADRVCIVMSDGRCDGDGECPEELVCGPDGLCREFCDAPNTCNTGRICALGACMDVAMAGDHCDDDGDGFLDPLRCLGSSCSRCGDCDDENPDVHPDSEELCDGLDNDCVGGPDDDEVDEDGDGVMVCDGDCDDADAALFPGAEELCDGFDNDCDGAPGDDEVDEDDDGFMVCDGDCDDTEELVNPEAVEVCDGLDNDCDGTAEAPIAGAGEVITIGDPAIEILGPDMAASPHGYAMAVSYHDEVSWWLGVYLYDPDDGSLEELGTAAAMSPLGAPALVWTGNRFIAFAVDVVTPGVLVLNIADDGDGWAPSSSTIVLSCREAVSAIPVQIDAAWDEQFVGLTWVAQEPSGAGAICALEYDPIYGSQAGRLLVDDTSLAPATPQMIAGFDTHRWTVGYTSGPEDSRVLTVTDLDLTPGAQERLSTEQVTGVDIRQPRLARGTDGGNGAIWFQTVSGARTLRFGTFTADSGVEVEGSPAQDDDPIGADLVSLDHDGTAYIAAWYSDRTDDQIAVALRPPERPGPWPAEAVTVPTDAPTGLSVRAAEFGWGVSWIDAVDDADTTRQLRFLALDGCN